MKVSILPAPAPPQHTQFEGRNRISAEDAMKHPFFLSLGERIHKLPDSECSWGVEWSVGGCGEWSCLRTAEQVVQDSATTPLREYNFVHMCDMFITNKLLSFKFLYLS